MMPVRGPSDFRKFLKVAFVVPVAASFVLSGCGAESEELPMETSPDLDPMIQMEDTTADPSLDVDNTVDDPAVSG